LRHGAPSPLGCLLLFPPFDFCPIPFKPGLIPFPHQKKKNTAFGCWRMPLAQVSPWMPFPLQAPAKTLGSLVGARCPSKRDLDLLMNPYTDGLNTTRNLVLGRTALTNPPSYIICGILKRHLIGSRWKGADYFSSEQRLQIIVCQSCTHEPEERKTEWYRLFSMYDAKSRPGPSFMFLPLFTSSSAISTVQFECVPHHPWIVYIP